MYILLEFVDYMSVIVEFVGFVRMLFVCDSHV